MSTTRPLPFRGYAIGLDLGQRHDPSALCLVERRGSARYTGAAGEALDLAVRKLQRWPLETPMPDIVEAVCAALEREPLASAEVTLAVDATGLGGPVVDLLRARLKRRPRGLAKLNFRPTLIHGGDRVSRDELFWRIPKRELAAAVQIALQQRRLRVAEKIDLADVLRTELATFKVKITTAGNDVYGTWREGEHDDLVLACAVAVWHALEAAGKVPTCGSALGPRRARPVGSWKPRIW